MEDELSVVLACLWCKLRVEAHRCKYLLDEPKILKEWRRSSDRGAGKDALRRLFGLPYKILSLGFPLMEKNGFIVLMFAN